MRSLLLWRPRPRQSKAAATVVVLGQPGVVFHTNRTGGVDKRSVKLLSRQGDVEAELAVDDVPALVRELNRAEVWRRGVTA